MLLPISHSSAISSYDARRAEILPLMKQREHPVADSTGVKWYCVRNVEKLMRKASLFLWIGIIPDVVGSV